MVLSTLALHGQARAQAQGPANLASVLADEDYYVVQLAKNAKDQATVEEFVSTCQMVTGINFVFTEAIQQTMGQKKLMGVGKLRIHKDDFYGFLQVQLFINDFVCVEVGPAHIAMVLIRSLTPTGGRQNTSIRQTATKVAPKDLQNYADQPATLITTVLNLPNVDSRTISQALRGMMVDTATQSLIPAGRNSLIITGFGSYVVSLAGLLQVVNDNSKPLVSKDSSTDVGAGAKPAKSAAPGACACQK